MDIERQLQKILDRAETNLRVVIENQTILTRVERKLDRLLPHNEPNSLQVEFGKPAPNLKGELEMSSTSGVFNSPNIDMVPYDVEALDASGAQVALSATQVLTLTSDSGSAIVVPNSTDATGATGNVVAAAGFVGPVSGKASLADSANPSFSLQGTWSGQFDASVTEPISLAIVFGTPAPAASGRR
jgi:hypothetical protein